MKRGLARESRSQRPALLALLLVAGCGGAPPPLHYYELVVPGQAREPTVTGSNTGSTLAVAPLTVDAAYDTERMVYRLSPYRIDYYNYHRWSASPGLQVADYLRKAYARTGLFRDVVPEPSADASLVLGGRLAAVEEIDATPQRWVGHVAVELWVRDAHSRERLWSAAYDRREPMPERSPEGLAAAISAALAHIVAESAPALARVSASR